MDSPGLTVCYRHRDTPAGVTCQRCSRPICPQCMNSASVGFQCPECVAGATSRVIRWQPGQLTRPVVAMALVAVNVLAYLWGAARPEGRDLSIDGGLIARAQFRGSPIGVDAGEWWRLVTSGFLHGGLLHLGFNMLLLWQLGSVLEPRLGRVRFALLYGASLLAGSAGVLLLDPDRLTIGASGAVFGLMAATALYQLSQGMNPWRTGIGGLVLVNLLLTFALPRVSIGGHLGGLVGGLLCGAAVFYGLEPGRPTAQTRTASVGAFVAIGVAAAAISLWAAGRPV
ncbi:MAG: rhomboid family intramembrane serine protease [Acidimicrobiales bacterium]